MDPRRYLQQAIRMDVLSREAVAAAGRWIELADEEGRELDLARALVERGFLDAAAADRVAGALSDRTGTIDTVVPLPDDSMPATRAAPVPPDGRRYVPGGVLGEGGMGVVESAFDRELEREVAVKSLAIDSARHRRRFLEEARLTARLEHPHIVPVHDLVVEPATGRPILVMKRVRGSSLLEVLDRIRDGRPGGEDEETPREVLSRLLHGFVKVCDAVTFAHSEGVLHRDLKPSNVMLGDFGEVFVMDWGLAKAHASPDGARETGAASGAWRDDGRTREGEVLGTPSYMSPEQARGESSSVGPASDVYGLGAILYHVLALTGPIEPGTWEEVVLRARRGIFEPPSGRSGAPWEVPRELEAVVLKAMALRPRDRYPSVRALQRDVEAYLAGVPLTAASYSPWQVVRMWAGRRKALVAAGLALLAGAIGIAVAVGLGERRRLREVAAVREHVEREADREFETGAAEWAAAAATPFNPSSPHPWFRVHLAALLRMGLALSRHPEPPPAWREEVARLALVVQQRAQDVSNWSLAQVLARSLVVWGALDEAAVEQRLAGASDAEDRAAAEDAAKLQQILDLIGAAEEGRGRQGRAILEGEVEERSRRLARASGPRIVPEVLARLRSGSPGGAGRILLIDLLGRSGDAVSEADRSSAPRLVEEALGDAGRSAFRGTSDELEAWVRAAGRLEARSPGAFVDLPRLLGGIAASDLTARRVQLAIEEVLALHGALRPGGSLRSLDLAGDEARRWSRLAELADWYAATVRDRGRATASFLDRIGAEAALATGQVAFLFDQLGLGGDADPPDPARPERAALPVLRRALEDEVARMLGGGAGRPAAEARAIAAARNLSRLGSGQDAARLQALRMGAGEHSSFWSATKLPLALLPEDASPAETAAGLVRRGVSRAERGDLSGAIADFTAALELQPDFAEALVGRGGARAALGEHVQAIEDLTRAIELSPGSPQTWLDRGVARHAGGDLAGAIDDFGRALEVQPGWVVALCNRSAVRCEQGDLAGAIEDASAAIRADPRNATAWGRRGLPRLAAGDPAGAIEDASRAIELAPDLASAWSLRGSARTWTGDLRGAVEDLGRSIALAPTDPAGYEDRARALRMAGDPTASLADYDRALAIDPRRASAWQGRSRARYQLGDGPGAIADLDRAIELAPDVAPFRNDRGIIHLEAEDVPAAIDDFAAATRIDPRMWEAWGNLGSALEAAGRLAEAAEAYGRALEVAPPGQRAGFEASRRRVGGR